MRERLSVTTMTLVDGAAELPCRRRYFPLESRSLDFIIAVSVSVHPAEQVSRRFISTRYVTSHP